LHICILYVGLCANIYKSTFVCFLLLSSVVPVFTHLLVAVPTLKALHQQRMPLFVLAVLHGRQRASVLDARAQMAPLGRRTHLFSRAFVLILVTDHDIEGQQHPNHHTCKRLAPLGLDTTPHTTMISVVAAYTPALEIWKHRTPTWISPISRSVKLKCFSRSASCAR
jgi:hypothetical protein